MSYLVHAVCPTCGFEDTEAIPEAYMSGVFETGFPCAHCNTKMRMETIIKGPATSLEQADKIMEEWGKGES